MCNNRIKIKYIICLILSLLVTNIAWSATTEKPDAKLRSILNNAINEADSFNDRFEAEVWLLDMSNRLKRKIKDNSKRIELLKNIHYEATRVKLPPELILAVIDIESNFNRWAISVVGARGLMQIMPFWLNEIGNKGDNLFDIRTNLRFGCTILKHYVDREKGDLQRGLARYNGSLGSTKYPNKVFDRLQKRWYKR